MQEYRSLLSMQEYRSGKQGWTQEFSIGGALGLHFLRSNLSDGTWAGAVGTHRHCQTPCLCKNSLSVRPVDPPILTGDLKIKDFLNSALIVLYWLTEYSCLVPQYRVGSSLSIDTKITKSLSFCTVINICR